MLVVNLTLKGSGASGSIACVVAKCRMKLLMKMLMTLMMEQCGTLGCQLIQG